MQVATPSDPLTLFSLGICLLGAQEGDAGCCSLKDGFVYDFSPEVGDGLRAAGDTV